ncbi:hypothetical protein BC938DRAFT_473265 [Jimgerdemannia flammicorona]|uniref:Uncharacterized protein n=1 Tax=Jimgerdemannia flammicorona TaxID=994334 RepID=A0A433QTE9_9FUNG|nr:hypothetical protein BC938DRAFT_473265 [Jimgerdemannia flammicorona]
MYLRRVITNNDTSDMRAVPYAFVQRILIGVSMDAIEIVANKIVTIRDLVAKAESATKSGVGVIDTSVNHTDLDALAIDTEGIVNLVHPGQVVGEVL